MEGHDRQFISYDFLVTSPSFFLFTLPVPPLMDLATGLLECHHDMAAGFPGVSDLRERAKKKSQCPLCPDLG